MSLNEAEALTILSMISGLGSIRVRFLMEHFGSALSVLEADSIALSELGYLPSGVIESICTWRSNDDWKHNFDLADRYGVSIIPFTSPEYPKILLDTRVDYPLVLYVQGTLQSINSSGIAVVGTRQASIYGQEMAHRISQDLAEMGFTVISGLARGIDTAAHRGALQAAKNRAKEGKAFTVAVVGSGLKPKIYPPENQALAQVISQHGAVVSEFPMATPPNAQNFPQRNATVSGLSRGVLLVEAPERSGAMITMEKAESQRNKVLFALPGQADYESFAGNHLLIAKGRAKLILSARDIADSFQDLFAASSSKKDKTESISSTVLLSLTPDETQLLMQLTHKEMTIDAIVQLTQTPVMKINVLLMGLVLKKAVKEFPGKIYKKIV